MVGNFGLEERPVVAAGLRDGISSLAELSTNSQQQSLREQAQRPEISKVISHRFGTPLNESIDIPYSKGWYCIRSTDFKAHLLRFARSLESKLAPGFRLEVNLSQFGGNAANDSFFLMRQEQPHEKKKEVGIWVRSASDANFFLYPCARTPWIKEVQDRVMSLKESAYFRILEGKVLRTMNKVLAGRQDTLPPARREYLERVEQQGGSAY